MHPQLRKAVNKIGDKSLRQRVTTLLEDPTIEIGGETYKGLPLEKSPAGLSHHHSYSGGLVEHMISTTSIALALCDTAESVYNARVDRDLVVAGALVHDIFKLLTYIERENGSYVSAPLAERLDHLTLGVAELIRRGFPLDTVHIVDSHMGWQHGPIGPRTVEALIVHLADMADSRLNGEVLRAAQYLLREGTGIELNRITATEAFEIVNAKTQKGWKAVPKVLDKIRKRRKKQS
jgi:7,8-dihydroneopterin 2',3'-cyclic phosphate phosphodiesterase